MIACGGLFAPTIRHHNGKFYIVCTNAVLLPSIKVDNFLISTTDIWSGQWSDPIPIPYPGIDPSLFFEDGRTYVQGCFSLGQVDSSNQPSCTIKQFEINVETGEKLTEPREIWAGHSCVDTEGPHIYKVGQWYYLVVAEGGTFEHHMLSIARSESIWGPYESYSQNPILSADGKPDEYIQNTGHGELFQDEAGQWWAIILAVRNEDTCQPLGRETFLARVDWPCHGWPQIEHPQSRFTACLPVVKSGHGREQDFQTKIRGLDTRLEYLYIRDPELSYYQLPESGGHGPFTLVPSQEGLSLPVGTCTFIGRRQRSLKAVAEAEIDLRATGVMAGLAVYKDHLRHLTLGFESMTRMVTFRAVNSTIDLDQATATTFLVEPTAKRLHLKIIASADEYRGFVATTHNGVHNDWVDLGSWETKRFAAREMTGPIFGLYAHAVHGTGQQAAVVFPSFTVDKQS